MMKVTVLALTIAVNLSAVVARPQPLQRSVGYAQHDTCSKLGSDTSLYVRDYDVEESECPCTVKSNLCSYS